MGIQFKIDGIPYGADHWTTLAVEIDRNSSATAHPE
jgi:hypothetical protein